MTQVLIRRDQELIALCLSVVEQFTVPKVRPSQFKCSIDGVFRKMRAKGRWCSLIEQYLQATESFRPLVSWSITLSTCHRSTPGNQSRNCSIVAPSLRFSKSAATGTLVLRNTHAPPTFSRSRSTAGQLAHVLMDSAYHRARAGGRQQQSQRHRFAGQSDCDVLRLRAVRAWRRSSPGCSSCAPWRRHRTASGGRHTRGSSP